MGSALPLNGAADAVAYGPFAALEGLASALVGAALTVNTTSQLGIGGSAIVTLTPGVDDDTLIVQCVDGIYELHRSGFYRLLVDLDP